MHASENVNPARPRTLAIEFDRSADELALVYRSRRWGAGTFLLLWLIGWTVGCIFLAGNVIRDPTVFNLLFAIPFWASWVFVFCMVLKMFCQREQFTLSADGAAFMRRVIVPIAARTIPLAEIVRFDRCRAVTNSDTGAFELGIEMATSGQPLRFASGLAERELNWLLNELNQQVAHLKGMMPEQPSDVFPQASDTPIEEAGKVGPLSLGRTPVAPPTDCRWERRDEFDSLDFIDRGKIQLSVVGILLFINLFWNGIVAVFVMTLFNGMGMPGIGWWGEFVFLIPFEVIGMLMFLALAFTVLEPFRRTLWRFDNSGIQCRLSWLGIGRTWRYPFEQLDRIELQRSTQMNNADANQQNMVSSCPWRPNDGRFGLSFVAPGDDEACAINGLTEGEARWIADCIFFERGDWFRKRH